MVKLHIKRGDESQFLYDTNLTVSVEKLLQEIVVIFNGRLKISRICAEMEELAKHGVMLPPEIIGLTDEQVEELKLTDPWSDRCIPSGGFIDNKDPIGRRNGRQPQLNMQDMLKKSMEDAKNIVGKNKVKLEETLIQKDIQNALDLLRGAVTICYPMQLPPHDPIRMEFTNTEDLDGTHAQLEVIEPAKGQLWFAGRQMMPDKTLSDYLGKNDKCKVILKLVKSSEGAPGREPVISEDQRKQMMLLAYRRQEELKVCSDSLVEVDDSEF